MSDCDVLIVGAGPAGSATAIRCAMNGLRVILVDRAAFPRHRPGETLHPGVEPLLRQLGVWERIKHARFVRHAGIRVGPQDHEQFTAFGADSEGPWLGLQAWRAEFDQILLERAGGWGVRVFERCAVRNAVVEGQAVVGVESNLGRISAEFVIDAAGGRHWLAHELSLPMQIESSALYARYGYVEGDYLPARDAPILSADVDGWTWIARVREQTYQWTRLSGNLNSAGQAGVAGSKLPTVLQRLVPKGHMCGADVTWRCAMLPAGPGYFLCGDAAAVLDPASSHGVLKALMSGIYAGHLIGQVRAQAKSKAAAAKEYIDWLARWFHTDVLKLREHYSEIGLAGLASAR